MQNSIRLVITTSSPDLDDSEAAEAKVASQRERGNREEERAKKVEERIMIEANRARVAEMELQKYKADAAQNTIPNAAEWEALENNRKRAVAMNDELLRRNYDYPAKIVLEQLLKANAKIDSLKNLLKNPSRQPSQIQLLTVLLDAEVNETSISKLDDVAINRQVIMKQSKAVNARLASLKTIINASEEEIDALKTLLKHLLTHRSQIHLLTFLLDAEVIERTISKVASFCGCGGDRAQLLCSGSRVPAKKTVLKSPMAPKQDGESTAINI